MSKMNSTLALGLSGLNEHGPARPFLDVLKHGRIWQAERTSGRGYDTRDLIAAGHVGADGWVKSIPADAKGGRILSAQIWGASGAPDSQIFGEFRLRWQGIGKIGTALGASVLSQVQGATSGEARINVHGGEWQLSVLSVDAQSPMKEMTLVRVDQTAAFDAGAIFDPDYLAVLEPARLIRFMDWQATNNSTIATWSDRKRRGGLERTGVAIEDMVELCNQTGCDGWFNVPHLADPDFITRMATYIRDTLDPTLKAYFEYSNENWNFSFQQVSWSLERSATVWGSSGGAGYINWTAKKAAEAMKIITNVFAGKLSRLVRVCGTQSVSPGITQALLEAPLWKQFEPDKWFDPMPFYDVVAGTTYFGGSHVGNEALRNRLLTAIDRGDTDPAFDAQEWFFNEHMDSTLVDGMPRVKQSWRGHRSYCKSVGKAFIAYEGGQHIHHSFAVQGITNEQLDRLTTFMVDFVASQWMADLYARSYLDWAEAGVSDGPYMQFGDVDKPSKYGSWHFRIHTREGGLTKRGRALLDVNRTLVPWWG